RRPLLGKSLREGLAGGQHGLGTGTCRPRGALRLFDHARVIHSVRSRLYITTLRNSPATQSQSRSVPSSVNPSFAASRRDDRFSGSIRASIRCTFRRGKQGEITGGAASVMRPWRQHDGTTIHPTASRRCCSLCALCV